MKRILKIPQFYKFYINLIGGKKFFKNYVEKYVSPKENQTILELGCGSGNILYYLPKTIDYTGLDLNSKCIKYCKKKFPSFEFLIKDVSDFNLNKTFDIIFSEGIMACLSDEQIEKMLKNICKHSKKDTKIILSDMNFCKENTKLQNFFLKQERGKYLRSTKDFIKIYSKFNNEFEIKEIIETRSAFKIPNSKSLVVLNRR